MPAHLLVTVNLDPDLANARHASVTANDLAALSELAQRVRGCPCIRTSITRPITES